MLGHGIAKRLAQAGASVTIVGRTERGIVDELNEVSPAGATATHTFVPVNAYLLSSVNTAVESIFSTHDKIDYLVQSQGPCLDVHSLISNCSPMFRGLRINFCDPSG
jgi:NAD(P)-dependent dehydrogenase (short-subunit alcohol dehydrogenase family)